MKSLEDMTLEEKVDELLQYQRKTHRTILIQSILKFLTFLIIILIPIVAYFYLKNLVTNAIGLSMEEIGEVLRRVKGLTEFGGLGGVKELFN